MKRKNLSFVFVLFLLASCGTANNSVDSANSQNSASIPTSEPILPSSDNKGNSSEKTSTGKAKAEDINQDMLDELSAGFSASGLVYTHTWIEGNEKHVRNYEFYDFSIDSSAYYSEIFASKNKDGYSETGDYEDTFDTIRPIDEFEKSDLESYAYYSKNPATGNAASSYLDISNQVIYSDLHNNKDQTVKYEDSPYKDPFDHIQVENFAPIISRPGWFRLDSTQENYTTINNQLSSMFAGQFRENDIAANDIYLYMDGYHITRFQIDFLVDGTYFGYHMIDNVLMDFEVTAYNGVEVPKCEVVTGTPDNDLVSILDSLDGATDFTDHYMMETGKVVNDSFTGEYYTSEDAWIYSDTREKEILLTSYAEDGSTQASETDAYYLLGNDALASAYKLGDKFYLNGPIKGDVKLEDTLPSFKISPLLFKKNEEGSYDLDIYIPGLNIIDSSSYSLYSNYVRNLNIAKKDNDIIFTTTAVDYKGNHIRYTNTYSNISSTLLPSFKVSEVENSTDSLTMSQMLSVADKNEALKTLKNISTLDLIPVLGGAHPVCFASDYGEEKALVFYLPEGAGNSELLNSYTRKLAIDFTSDGKTEYNDTIYKYSHEIKIGQKNYDLKITPFCYEQASYFVIVYSLTEVA